MKTKICVLGAGLVGKAIALDLANAGYRVRLIDRDDKRIIHHPAIEFVSADIMNEEDITTLTKNCEVVAGALPGSLGFKILKMLIAAGKNVVDISFCPEDYMELDELAKSKDVTIVPDMGIAPGFCNLLCGYHNQRMKITSYRCLVGGLPKERIWPLEYKASWSPADVIEEYVRPARFRQNGKEVTKPALSDNKLSYFKGIGSLEEWNSDGLRSLLKTMPHIPDMVEKTLRYPGTVEYLKVLRELGYFSSEEIEINGTFIRPVDLSAKLLFPLWELKKGEDEFTVMKVIIEGEEEGKKKTYSYYIYDEYNHEENLSSMARTTGYSCTAAVNLLLDGKFTRKGICPPEYLGKDKDNYDFFLDHLKSRNISIERTTKEF